MAQDQEEDIQVETVNLVTEDAYNVSVSNLGQQVSSMNGLSVPGSKNASLLLPMDASIEKEPIGFERDDDLFD
jgi:hypothetical protein